MTVHLARILEKNTRLIFKMTLVIINYGNNWIVTLSWRNL